ncbi:hypothetical protein ACHAWF_001116, partial [Thalassiosira exigua]
HARAPRGPVPDDVARFRSILSRPERRLFPAATTTRETPRGNWSGLVQPQLDGAISRIVPRRRCFRYCDIVTTVAWEWCPGGGNTGLCGGAAPIENEVILSLEDTDEVYDFDEQSGILACDAGCVLHDFREFAEERGRPFPLDVGSKVRFGE